MESRRKVGLCCLPPPLDALSASNVFCWPFSADEVWVFDITVHPWVHWRTGEVWVDIITVGRWMLWGTGEVWLDVIMVLAHG